MVTPIFNPIIMDTPEERERLLTSVSESNQESLNDLQVQIDQDTNSESQIRPFIKMGLAFLAILSILFYLAFYFFANAPVRGVILMISDGFGPTSASFSRQYYQFINGNSSLLPLDTILGFIFCN